MPQPITSIDLFAGCGGFSLGLEQAGIRTLAAIDFDPHAITTHRTNFPHVPNTLQADLAQLSPTNFSQTTNIQPGDVDLIVGGPPCQGFSQARQRDGANHDGGAHVLL